MIELMTEAVEKLIRNDERYVLDALGTIAVQFQRMSDDGVDSLYAEPARRWRHLESNVKRINDADSEYSFDELDDSDIQFIATGILWYELNT